MNSDATIGQSSTYTPADDTPIASTRGILEAAVLNAVTISLKWYVGSSVTLGYHTTSSEYTDSPSITADTLRSLPPASKPMRQPSLWPPMGLAASLAAGKSASEQTTTSRGFSYTSSTNPKSKARSPAALYASASFAAMSSQPHR